MVNAMINISKQANQILNIVKAKHDFKDKSQAIDYVAKMYGEEILELNLRPEYVKKLKKRTKEATIQIDDFEKHFKLK